MDTINKVLSVEYCWAWMIPLVTVMMVVGPNEITQFELYELGFLWIGWWFAYPPRVVKYLTEGDVDAECILGSIYWTSSIIGVIVLGVVLYFK